MPSKAKPQAVPPENQPQKEELSSQKDPQPKSKYAPKPKVIPSIGRNQVGGKRQRVTPKFNSVSTELH
jgi:hypothetical protein